MACNSPLTTAEMEDMTRDYDPEAIADEVFVAEGDLYDVYGEAEMIVTFDCLVGAKVGDTIYYHQQAFPGHVRDEDGFAHVSYSHKEAAALVDRIRAAGMKINLEHWNIG